MIYYLHTGIIDQMSRVDEIVSKLIIINRRRRVINHTIIVREVDAVDQGAISLIRSIALL
jgi:hypothetical protein